MNAPLYLAKGGLTDEVGFDAMPDAGASPQVGS